MPETILPHPEEVAKQPSRRTLGADATVSDALLEVRGLKRYFDASPSAFERLLQGKPRLWVKALDGVSFAINRGETFSLVGESGCGKSTAARCIVGLYPPSAGALVFDGIEIGSRGSRRPAPVQRRMQMIFQDPYASLDPRWRVRRIIAEPLVTHGLLSDKAALRGRVSE